MPMNISIKYARLPHGLVYFYQHWIPDRPRALVVYVHGLGDHIGRYGEFVSRLTQHNLAVALYDQRGHGRSDGPRGHVERFEEWVSDLASFVHFSQMSVPVDTPLVLIGQSMGALVSLNYILTHHAPVNALITISACIKPTVSIPEWKKKLARRFAGFIPNISIQNGIHFDDLTSDPEEQSALRQDTLFHSRISVKAGLELERNLELVMAMPHRIHIPCLMFAGLDDHICDPDGTRQFALRLSSQDRTHRLIAGMKHDLLHESGREAVIEEIESWLDERLSRLVQTDKQFALHRREVLWENVSLPSS